MDEYTDLMIPPKPQKEHRIFFGSILIGIFRNSVSLFWGENSSTAREISDLTPAQLKSLLSEKDLWVIFDANERAIGISRKNLTPV